MFDDIEEDLGKFGVGPKRGPYGTNPGDQWLAPGSDMQNALDARGDGLVLIHWINDDGDEALYTTSNPEMIAEAQLGHELYVAALAARN